VKAPSVRGPGLMLAVCGLVLSAFVGFAAAERSGRAGVEVALDGGVLPRRLPRHREVPVSIVLAASIRSSERSALPQLRKFELAFGARGGLTTAGLPLCPRPRLLNATRRQALERCGPALVGRGTLLAEVRLDAAARPIFARAGVLAFNAQSHGRPAVWVHAYSLSPPVSFVIPFYLRRLRKGDFGLHLTAPIADALGPWPRLRSFNVTLGRRYQAGGEARSYLSARCPLPPRFQIGFFPLARATYRFAPGPTLSVGILRGCRVRD
jgi:hypothetical protein